MKNIFYSVCFLIVLLTSCKDDDINLFDKSADERVAEAIANLKAKLVAPANGWKVNYRPEAESGSYYVLMDFNEDNTVTIKTDLGFQSGRFFDQTITYRIDNSLGLELIFESYSFFSFLFEQNQATFGAEYEFNFVNQTPDNTLVFSSKSDFFNPTLLIFEEATAVDEDELLGQPLASQLNVLAADLKKAVPSLKLTYQDKDLVFYISLNEIRRIFTISSASKKTDVESNQTIDFSTGYFFKGDSLILDRALTGNFQGVSTTLKSIKFNQLVDTEIVGCSDPIPAHGYEGTTSVNDDVLLETSLEDPLGGSFAESSDIFLGSIGNIYQNGEPLWSNISQDIVGAVYIVLYYNFQTTNGVRNAIGFYIENPSGNPTIALHNFTGVLDGNKLSLSLASGISIVGSTTTNAELSNMKPYLDLLTEGGNTYVFKAQEGLYELYNPCTQFRVVLEAL